jgi:hypothetical protein
MPVSKDRYTHSESEGNWPGSVPSVTVLRWLHCRSVMALVRPSFTLAPLSLHPRNCPPVQNPARPRCL